MIKTIVRWMFFFLLALPLGAADEPVTLKYTYRPETATVTVLRDIQGKTYLPLSDVAQFFGIQTSFDSQTRKVTLTKGKSQVKLILSQPVFMTVDPPGSFPIDPVEVVSGQLGILPDSAEDVFGTILNVSVRFIPEEQTLVAGGIKPEELKEEILAAGQKKVARPVPMATPTLAAEVPSALESTPGEQAKNEVPEQVAPVIPPSKAEEEAPSNQTYRVQRIVIDPGHGGRDVGAKGFDKKYCEKQATLDIAKRVAELLKEDDKIEVLMTRDTDKYITLKYRTDFANRNNADLFVSIHCNSNPRSLATGTEIYTYGDKPSNKLAAVEAVRENVESTDTLGLLADLSHRFYKKRSFSLATKVKDRIMVSLKQHIRKVYRAPFYVLRQVDMPSVLIETAFISNRTEETKLEDPYWRDKIAKCIADGILAFRDEMESTSENQQARR